MVDEVIHADKWGFDLFGVSEQHVAVGAATTASPEVLDGYLHGKTSRIRFRHTISLIPANHPLKIAANVAVADILSNGRIEVGIGRGNTTLSLRAFEVDLDTNRDKALEGIETLKRAFTEDPFMFHGEHYKIPPRSLTPKPIQKPHPNIHMAATSDDSHDHCANLGIGVLSLSNFLGWDFLANNISRYREGIKKTREKGGYVNESVGVLVHAYCDETDEMAREVAGDANLDHVHVAYSGYPRLAKMAESYEYMGALAEVGEKINDIDYLIDESAAAVMGSPAARLYRRRFSAYRQQWFRLAHNAQQSEVLDKRASGKAWARSRFDHGADGQPERGDGGVEQDRPPLELPRASDLSRAGNARGGLQARSSVDELGATELVSWRHHGSIRVSGKAWTSCVTEPRETSHFVWLQVLASSSRRDEARG